MNSLYQKIKNHGKKLAVVGALGLAALVTGCDVERCDVEQPYYYTTIENLISKPFIYNKDRVVVEGIPTEIKKDNSLVIENVGGQNMNITRGPSDLGAKDSSDFLKAAIAIQKEIGDGDNEAVKVIGIFYEDKGIEAMFIEVEGSLYPVYE